MTLRQWKVNSVKWISLTPEALVVFPPYSSFLSDVKKAFSQFVVKTGSLIHGDRKPCNHGSPSVYMAVCKHENENFINLTALKGYAIYSRRSSHNSTLKVKVTIKREEFHENSGQECPKQIVNNPTLYGYHFSVWFEAPLIIHCPNLNGPWDQYNCKKRPT